jgi:hypothetical protein
MVVRQIAGNFRKKPEMKDPLLKPLQALDWLQNAGGLTVEEAEAFREEVKAEREAQHVI